MLNKKPNNKCSKAVYNPPENNQIILKMTDKQPVLLLSLTTLLPNGINTIKPILKHCKPKGIPIMVQHKIKPPKKYPKADIKPPNISQIILPSKFIKWCCEKIIKRVSAIISLIYYKNFIINYLQYI